MNPTYRSTVWRTGWLFGGLVLVLASAAAADESIRIPTAVSGHMHEIPGEDLGLEVRDGAVNVSIDQAIGLALRQNLTIVVQRYQRSQAVATIEQNLGIYDINLAANGGIAEDTFPTTSALQATGGGALTRESQQLNLQAARLTPAGGTFQIDFNNSRVLTSDLNNTLNPSFSLDFDVTFSQPLARNFGRYVTEQNLIVARTNADISRENFRSLVESTIQQASDSYWDLVESLEQLAVAEESLELAKNLHRMNQIQVEVGTQAPLEVVTSEARVAARRQDIIRFRAQVEDDADDLRRLANLDRGTLWDVEIVPTTDPEIAHAPIDVEAAVKAALENRTDVQIRKLQLDNLELNARVARNQKRPAFNVAVTYGANAAEGDAFVFIEDPDTGDRTRIPVGSTDYIDGLDTISRVDFDGWNVRFNFSYPLGNRTAKAASVVADLAHDQGEYILRDLELQVLTFVRQAARAVETAAEQIESAKVSSNLQRRNLEAEEKRYENGLATSFQVLEVQEDLSEARSAEVSAIISYRRALVAFYLSIGKLLDEFNVVLADDVEIE